MASQHEPIQPKGSRSYPIEKLKPEDFEDMCNRLVRIEHPEAVSTAAKKDGGADALLRDGKGGYARCWQHKNMPKQINWANLEKSLEAATETYGMPHYTFTFPQNLGAKDQAEFNKRFCGGDATVKVDYVGYDELQEQLNGSVRGDRVARSFFGSAADDTERMAQAVEAGGRLNTPQDALDRLLNIGSAAAKMDPFFQYPFAMHEEGSSAPGLTPGAVMSMSESDGLVVSRVDLVPRDDEAMEKYGPKFQLKTSADEAGRRAAEALDKALREGIQVQIDEGIEFTFTNLPPALADLVDRPISASITLGPSEHIRREIPPWAARMTITPTSGDPRDVNMSLMQTDEVPDGWDDCVTGEFGGLRATLLFRREGNGGRIAANFKFDLMEASVTDRLDALRFMQALSTGGELVIRDLDGRDRDLIFDAAPKALPEDAVRLAEELLQNVLVIEDWAGLQLTLPEDVSGKDAFNVARVAETVRRQGIPVTWDSFEFVIGDESNIEPLRNSAPIAYEQKVGANILGTFVALGYARIEITDYEVVSSVPEPGSPGQLRVRIEPKTSNAVFQTLAREPTLGASAEA